MGFPFFILPVSRVRKIDGERGERDARDSLSPHAGRGWGEGAPTLPERCGLYLGRRKIPDKLRIAERPPHPNLLPARGEKEARATTQALSSSRRDARERNAENERHEKKLPPSK